jgi:hypothetical protein
MEGKMRMREFPGIVHGPFGIYRKGTIRPFNLVHPPTGCTLTALPKQRQCKALAVELAALAMNWEESDPEKVGGADAGRVFGILMKAERAALPSPRIVNDPETVVAGHRRASSRIDAAELAG